MDFSQVISVISSVVKFIIDSGIIEKVLGMIKEAAPAIIEAISGLIGA